MPLEKRLPGGSVQLLVKPALGQDGDAVPPALAARQQRRADAANQLPPLDRPLIVFS